jgi:chromosome segregation ATPase
MSNYEADDEDDGDDGHAVPALDAFSAALVLIDLALNPKAAKVGLKQLARLDKDIGAAEQKLAAVTAAAEQTKTALAERETAIVAREAVLEQRERTLDERETEARDNLRAYYDNLADTDRRIRYRIMASADLLAGFNEQLQDLPSWQQIKQMVPGLPADLPAAPAAEVVTREVREDWAGSVFAPSTLTRTVSQ